MLVVSLGGLRPCEFNAGQKMGTHELTLGSRSGLIVVILEFHLLVAVLLFLPLCITPGRTIFIPRPFLG